MNFRFAKLPRGILKPMTYKKKVDGEYQGGIWVPSTETIEGFMGVLLPLTEKDLKTAPGNMYTTDDYKLYTETDFPSNTEITDNLGDIWNITRARDYRDLGTFRRYYAQKVGEASE